MVEGKMDDQMVREQTKAYGPIGSLGQSDTGRRRKENQDAFGIIEKDQFSLYFVADGMGGEKGGAVAAGIAVSAVERFFKERTSIDQESLCEAIQEANLEIIARANKERGLQKMGTTFVAVAFSGSDVFVANVGDSRAYFFRKGMLETLTEDHTVVAELARAGTLTAEQAQRNPLSHMLTRSLGANPQLLIDCYCAPELCSAGNTFLLCSDGLHGVVSAKEILSLLQLPLQDAVPALIRCANAKGGPDNITALAVQLGEVRRREIAKSKRVRDQVPVVMKGASSGVSRSIPPANRPNRITLGKRGAGILASLLVGTGLLIGLGASSLLRIGGKPQSELGSAEQLTQLPNIEQFDSVQDLRLGYKPDLLEMEGPKLPVRSGSELGRASSADHDIVQGLQDELQTVRMNIEVTTRRLALWHGRQKSLKQLDPLQLALEVAISSETVREKYKQFNEVNERYLRAAEELVYNPLDRNQEKQVRELTKVRNSLRADLREEVHAVVGQQVVKSVGDLNELTHQRDRIQAELHAATQAAS